MELFSVVVLKERLEDVTSRLLHLGIFHPVDIRHVEKELSELSSYEIDREYAQLDGLDSRLKGSLKKIDIPLIQKKEIKNYSLDSIDAILNELELRINPFLNQKEDLCSELETKNSILNQLKAYPLFPLRRDSVYSFLEVSLGRVAENNISVIERSLKDIPYVLYPIKKEEDKIAALFIGLRRDKVYIDRVLKDISWEKADYPKDAGKVSKDVEGRILAEIDAINRKRTEIIGLIKKIGEEYHEKLSDINLFIKLKKSLLETKKYLCITEKTAVLSGWIPREEKENVIKEIKKIDNECYLETKEAEKVDISKDEIPVRYRHPGFMRPFELLIDSYGMPRYGTIDPTIFVAISFLIMFGAMFGDIGHGIVLCIVSMFLKKGKNEKLKQASSLMIYCGFSSLVFGALYGSFFGKEFHGAWIKPMENIMEIFRWSVMFGMVFITVGVILNIINALRDRDYLKAIFDKAGLIGGIVYWTAIGFFTKMLMAKEKASPIYLIVIASGFILFFLKPFIEALLKKEKQNGFVTMMESTIDMLEIGMSYLANTVSFIRIAAFALAHTGLFFAIFELSDIVDSGNTLGHMISFLVVILGNVLIIFLEGLVVTIQSLRLNYYEFFSKFFVLGKNTYKPVKI